MTGPELTEFLHRHRTLLIIGVLFFLFVGLAVLGYNKYQQHQMQQAALLYSELVNATIHKNNSVARASAESIINTYNDTPYGTLAHFFLARLDMEGKQVAVAEKAFKAIIDHHEVPLGMHSMARLSLARLYVDHHHPHIYHDYGFAEDQMMQFVGHHPMDCFMCLVYEAFHRRHIIT
ncbi:hypothetical protein BAE47_12020 [Acidithiobacillus thiooxidans]|uniref:YfgM family protein n=1 Tax=Acidithiobacillus thiooxidans TaxID=930 RepID=UPI0008271695|nr:tetratricopeptide repeat protein [Acidithiobacillus thiooxidans]OCX83188.1 hypothetical protein A6O26_07640 [Acidithiobacillus thiooxidans]OFC44003.1 hypothetical protein BAE47_12020 [Acidithiobacillus thiooxidans]